MAKLEDLIAEAEKVQNVINETNTLMQKPASSLGSEFTRQMQNKGSYIAAKLGPQVSKALNSGRPEELIIGVAALGTAWVGAYGIDAIRNAHSAAKAKGILLACYKELAVKQNMIVDEQQRLIEAICAENRIRNAELRENERRLRRITQQLAVITKLQKERTV